MTMPLTAPIRTSATKALLFDLGGVLVDIDFSLAIKAWSRCSALSAAELQSRFKFDEAYQRHERGEIGAPEYFAHLTRRLELTATAEEVEAGWNAIFVGEIAQTRRLVQQVRQKLSCHAFTNTNASHTQRWSVLYPEVASAFDTIFASHEIGLRKPERQAFDHICRTLQLSPDSILFFDDLAENVQAAQAAGLQAVLVRSPDDVAGALRSLGLV